MGRRRGRRRNTRTARGRRAANRARARSRAQASARKRVSARKAAGRKPSGANKSANRAAARARAQAAAKKRIAQKRTISQTKAANQKRMRDAAAARNKAFQQRKAAEAKAKQQRAAARRKAAAEASSRKAAADRSRKAAAAKRAADAKAAAANSRKAAVDRARKAAAARKTAAANPTKSFGPVADGATYARNLTNYNMKYGKTPEIRAKAYEQSLDPKSFKGLSDGQTFGVGPVASGDAYARGLNTDNQNVENRLRQVRNLASTLTGGLVPGVRKLTDKEIADRRVKVAARRKADFMGRPTGGKGNKGILGIQPEPEIVEEITPDPVEDTTVEDTTPPELAALQQDAYQNALNNYTGGTGAGGTGGLGGIGVMGGLSDAVMQQLMAGNRGKKRFRYGMARRRGADNMLQRDSMRFKPFTTIGQLNI